MTTNSAILVVGGIAVLVIVGFLALQDHRKEQKRKSQGDYWIMGGKQPRQNTGDGASPGAGPDSNVDGSGGD